MDRVYVVERNFVLYPEFSGNCGLLHFGSLFYDNHNHAMITKLGVERQSSMQRTTATRSNARLSKFLIVPIGLRSFELFQIHSFLSCANSFSIMVIYELGWLLEKFKIRSKQNYMRFDYFDK